jgi:tetratricopeptide (TPR) repeat protein
MVKKPREKNRMSKRFQYAAALAIAFFFGAAPGFAKDHITLNIPLRSKTSPVQKLNREGVEAVRRNSYEKAEALFYKAYLYDPADPFTLNNLGYVAELQGQLDRAHMYYQLATEQGCDAPIDLSSMKSLKGKPMRAAYDVLADRPMRVNRMNLDAMQLLAQNHPFEAVTRFKDALKLDPYNPFTMNNLAVADESLGDFDEALRYYQEVADLHSSERVTVTADRNWRGRSVSAMAAASAKRLKNRMQAMPPEELEAARYSVRGVYEANANQQEAARQDFLRAYEADPRSAFSLNNRGYVAEEDGDLETAQFFYEKAWRATDATARVGLATNRYANGRPVITVATDSDGKVGEALDVYHYERRRENGPVELTPRNGAQAAPDNQQQQNSPDEPQLTPRQPQNQ